MTGFLPKIDRLEGIGGQGHGSNWEDGGWIAFQLGCRRRPAFQEVTSVLAVAPAAAVGGVILTDEVLELEWKHQRGEDPGLEKTWSFPEEV